MAFDLTDETYGCIRILGRAPKAPSCHASLWRVKCLACGADHVMGTGIIRNNPHRRSCPACRGSRMLDKSHHPGFVNMTGERRAGTTVLKRQPNRRNGNAVWQVQCDTCGAIFDVEGIRLRAQKRVCRACRPKRPGTVTRKAAR